MAYLSLKGSSPFFFVALLMCLACSAPKLTRYRVTARVLSDTQEPILGAEVFDGNKLLGQTDKQGKLVIELQGNDGQIKTLSVECPNGYRIEQAKKPVTLLTLQLLDKERAAQGQQLDWRCIPTERLAVLVVRTPEQDLLPVTIHGQAVAKTDKNGIAHALLRLPPGTKFRARIETASNPKLVPQNPERTFAVKDRDALFLFEQRFAEKKVKRKRRARKKQHARHIPYRIQ
jgi:hypothetical protein